MNDEFQQQPDKSINTLCINSVKNNASEPTLERCGGSPISISMKAASSGRARGSTPGSLKLVLSNMAMTKRKRTAANTGMAGETWTARNGHL